MPQPSKLSICRATTADAAGLTELGARTFAETFGPDNRPEDLQAYLDASFGPAQQRAELQDPDVLTLLARRNQELLGFAQVRRGPVPPCVTVAPAVELHRLYVQKASHGTGVASALMQETRKAARALGGQYLWLGVWEHNPRAKAFYAKCGFARVGSHDFWVGSDRQTDWVLLTALQ